MIFQVAAGQVIDLDWTAMQYLVILTDLLVEVAMLLFVFLVLVVWLLGVVGVLMSLVVCP